MSHRKRPTAALVTAGSGSTQLGLLATGVCCMPNPCPTPRK